MEKDQDPNDSPDESSPESPTAEIVDENEDSNIDFVDSSEKEDEYGERKENGVAKSFEFSSRNSLAEDGPAAMEGELDFEDEVCEDKETIDEDSQKEITDPEKTVGDQNFNAEENDAPEEEEDEEVEAKVLSEESGDEDGQITDDEQPSKTTKKEGSIEEGEDDGELSEEDDLEEGEVKDSSPSNKSQGRQVCRFFNRGQCTWGNLCRFLHLSVNDRGNYNMFAPSAKMMPPYGPAGNGPLGPRGGPCGGPDYIPPLPPPPLPPPPPPVADPAPVESAWERGLRHAKELIKKSTRRKEQEPDFEEKRLNQSLSSEGNDRDTAEFEKENVSYGKSYQRRPSEPYNRYDDVDEVFGNGDREVRDNWHSGRYENFEVRWTRQEMNKERRPEKDRSRNSRFSKEREKSKPWRNSQGAAGASNKWRDERLNEVQASRQRADEWRDPWRRSKSPKGRRSRSRGRSHGSYSSVSSRSYSERSSRSSYSYSRSTSRSSFYSSHSPSPGNSAFKRRPSPPKKEALPPEKVLNRSPAYKKKPPVVRRAASRSYSRSRSSPSPRRSISTSSRSATRTPSISRSRSRSYSRSLSMDSVSSASSSISHSTRSGSGKKRIHASLLKDDVKTSGNKNEQSKPSTLFEEMQRLKNSDKLRDVQKVISATATLKDKKPETPSRKSPVLKEKLEPVLPPPLPVQMIPTPAEMVAKEPPKQPQQKQIKLTLLNKALPSKIPNPLKKDETPKIKLPEKDDKPAAKTATKRPASPPAGKPALAVKRSTSSRRDELLKQLKAVEDAIARKRAKFS